MTSLADQQLQILMPMGGLGQRFRDAGYALPKPLIPVDGAPMFRRALASWEAWPGGRRTIVIVRTEDDARFGLTPAILHADPSIELLTLHQNTRGAVETALLAADTLDADAPLVLMDCDIAFRSSSYFGRIARMDEDGLDGMLLSFPSREPRYSYAQPDPEGVVVRTAEKNPISDSALMGVYLFRRAGDFLSAGRELIAGGISADAPEFYVSLVFNLLIAQGKRIGLVNGTFYCFGTPGELAEYERTGEPVAWEAEA